MADHKDDSLCCANQNIPKECLRLCDLSLSADWHFNPETKKQCDAVVRQGDLLIMYQCYEKNAYKNVRQKKSISTKNLFV
uniref:Uncharacterized protein n=1 Tax=Ditylenchus dipsaci TaxID=166011 RepID=A0A915CXX8_9BILA